MVVGLIGTVSLRSFISSSANKSITPTQTLADISMLMYEFFFYGVNKFSYISKTHIKVYRSIQQHRKQIESGGTRLVRNPDKPPKKGVGVCLTLQKKSTPPLSFIYIEAISFPSSCNQGYIIN